MRTAVRLTHIALAVALLAVVTACAPGQRACRFDGPFAQLAGQIPDVVGTCQGAQIAVAEMGETVQPTTTGRMVTRSVDGLTSFSDTTQSYVMDASGQVHVRSLRERFAWEFNADGFPLVGAQGQDVDRACPGETLRVLAVENFYADLVRQLGGQCVSVTAILSDPAADPHEFQPGTSDVLAYQHAQLVIQNGLGYDDFSDRILATLASQPVLIDAGEVLGLQAGDNPHVWYSPASVDQLRTAMSAGLKQLAPEYATYFDVQSHAVEQRMGTYRGLVSQLGAQFGGTPVGSTETIFEYVADSTDLQLISPPGFMRAVSEGNEPSARDIARFHDQISSHRIRVLVYNTQTLTNLIEQFQSLAHDNDIPTVGVSETMPLEAQTFQGWQATQLQLLLMALQSAD